MTATRDARTGLLALGLLLACARTPDTGGAGGAAGGAGSGGAGGGGGTGGTGGSSAGPGCGGASGGGGGPGAPARPFGSHPLKYAAGILPAGGQANLDGAVRNAYDRWKRTYVTEGCGGAYVKTGGGTGASAALTVSEGHGYGMIATVIMAGHDAQAQATFDGFYRVFQAFRSENNPELMLWAINPGCTRHPDAASATDGDLDIAYALLLADRQWGSGGAVNYAGAACRAIQAVNRSDINATTRLPRLGDWVSSGAFVTAVRASDLMPGHFRGFGVAGAPGDWTKSVDASYALVASVQDQLSPQTGLVPDFVLGTETASPRAAPPDFHEGADDGRYYYNACRLPWRLGTDFVATGDARARAALNKITTWIKTRAGNDPGRIRDGYGLDGSETGQGGSLAFEAPFGVAAMADASHQAWLNAIYQRVAAASALGYYEDTVALLSLIVMTGNWWVP